MFVWFQASADLILFALELVSNMLCSIICRKNLAILLIKSGVLCIYTITSALLRSHITIVKCMQNIANLNILEVHFNPNLVNPFSKLQQKYSTGIGCQSFNVWCMQLKMTLLYCVNLLHEVICNVF